MRLDTPRGLSPASASAPQAPAECPTMTVPSGRTKDCPRRKDSAAGEIAAALSFLRGQSFVRPEGTVIVGHSAGAWGALALAGDNPQGVSSLIAFAPGRGGHANDFPNQVCAPHTLLSAAAAFGKGARVPVTWLVAANDSYFPPTLSRQLAGAFRGGGDSVDFHVLAASASQWPS